MVLLLFRLIVGSQAMHKIIDKWAPFCRNCTIQVNGAQAGDFLSFGYQLHYITDFRYEHVRCTTEFDELEGKII